MSITPLHDLLALPMLQAFPHPAFLLSHDLKQVHTNAPFAKLVPEPIQTWEGVLAWVHPRDRQQVAQTVLSHLETLQPFTVTFEALDHNRDHQPFRWQVNPLQHNHEVLGWLGTVERVDQSPMYLRAILEHLPLTMMVLDLDGEVKLMNQALSGVVERPRSQYLGQNITEADPRYGPVFMEVLEEIKRKPQALPPRDYHTHTGEHWRTYHFPVKDPGGTLLALGSASINITEQKRFEQQLEQQKAYWHRLTDEIPATVQLRDMGSNEVLFTNRFSTAVLGYTWEEVRDFTPEQALAHFHPDDLPRLYQVAEDLKTLPEGHSLQGEYRMLHKDGSWRWIDARLSIFERDPAGRPLQSLSVGLDITERKRFELQLQEEEQRLQRTLQGHERFVSEAAHEIKSPLAGIQGNLELLIRYPQMDDLEKQEVFSDCHREVVRLGRLVTDLLAAARTGNKPLLLETEVQLDALLLDTVREFEFQKGNHTLQVGEVEGCVICGDPDRLKQLLVILTSNALKYTPDGGEVFFHLNRQAQVATLQIQDTGVGIPAEDLQKVFERHYRARHEGFADPGGSGLGLSLARWIVQEHGGQIWLESEVGKGTTVWVTLPALPE